MLVDLVAALLPLALGVLAGVLSFYPQKGHWRIFWSAIFIVLGLSASIATALVVRSSETFEQALSTELLGGDNYCYVWFAKTNSPDYFELIVAMAKDTPLYDVDITLSDFNATTQERTHGVFLRVIKTFHFDTLRSLTDLNYKVGEGAYFLSIEARNGEGMQRIKLTKTPTGLSDKTTVTWWPVGEVNKARVVRHVP